MAFMFTHTHLYVRGLGRRERNSRDLQNSEAFLLNSTLQFLSSIDCSDIELCFQILPRKISRGFKSGEHGGQEIVTSHLGPIRLLG
jgi:hypothetical protein